MCVYLPYELGVLELLLFWLSLLMTAMTAEVAGEKAWGWCPMGTPAKRKERLSSLSWLLLLLSFVNVVAANHGCCC